MKIWKNENGKIENWKMENGFKHEKWEIPSRNPDFSGNNYFRPREEGGGV